LRLRLAVQVLQQHLPDSGIYAIHGTTINGAFSERALTAVKKFPDG
jgi:hypothetical protein